MKKGCDTKLEKVFHDLFAATLREPSTSSRDDALGSRKVQYAQKVAALARRLSDTNSMKLNLLKAIRLNKLPEVERNFLKAAAPVLTCAARPYNTPSDLEKGTAIINNWAGLSDEKDQPGPADVKELLITPQAFKNALLKLLNGNSDDERIVEMRNHSGGEPWSDAIEDCNSTGDDDEECTFKPKITGYPAYLKKAPKKHTSVTPAARKLAQVLQKSHEKYEYDDEHCSPMERNKKDYASPSNNLCPLTMAHDNDSEDDDIFYSKPLSVKDILQEAGSQEDARKAASRRRGTEYQLRTSPENGHRNTRNSISQLFSDEYIEQMLNSIPGIEERLAKTTLSRHHVPQMRYITPHRNHICSELGGAHDQENTSSWPGTLRGGYLRNPMRFSIDSHPKHGIEQSCQPHVGSLKNCDYVLPSGMAKPVFSKNLSGIPHDNAVYESRHGDSYNSGNPLDALEAQLESPTFNVLQLRC